MQTVALIPAYQPSMGLIDVLDRLRCRGVDCVVIDDGSKDGYRSIFQRATRDAIVLSYFANRGKGHALKLGLQYIQEHYPPDTVVVTVDADGQHCPDDALRCANVAGQNPHELVLGCRDFDDVAVPLRSRLGNKITRSTFGLLSGVHVSDTQTGLRAFTADLIPFFSGVSGERYEYEMNVLMACPEHKVALREVPIQTIYRDGNAESHFRPVIDSLRIYSGIFAFAAMSFASFLIDFALFGAFSAAFSQLGIGIGALLAANILARLLSATANYLLNRSVVFHSTEPVAHTAPRYAACALGLLAGNSLALSLVVGVLGAPPLPAKLLVECCSFVVSWLLQNRMVFQRKAWYLNEN